MDDRTAYKMFTRDIAERTLTKDENERSYIEYNNLKVYTVRVMGVVVSKYDSERFTILTVDDSTETLSVRAFGEDKDVFEGVDVGDTVDVIGTLREYEEETYLAPRSVTKIDDPNWEITRNLELLIRAKKSGSTVSQEEILDVEEKTESDLTPIVMALIEKLDSGDGADYNSLLKDSGLKDSQLDETLNSLLSSSEIYEPKIGKFKKV